jgi:hypothetical protein
VPSFSEHAEATYELLRPLVLFGQPVRERARETGVSERAPRRKVARFAATGMRSLFAPDELPTSARRTPRWGSARRSSSGTSALRSTRSPPISCRRVLAGAGLPAE